MGEMAVALARSVLHPIRTVGDLAQLPDTVALLIASSPEYFARYGAMSREDQIREAARLSTHLVMMLGGGAEAVSAVGGMGGLGAELPVLSLTAEGELALDGVVVAGGTMTATLGVDLGALSILHMASSSPGKSGGASGKAGKASKTASTNTTASGPGRVNRRSQGRTGRSLAPAVACGAPGQPGGNHPSDGEAGGDEAVVEVALRPGAAARGLHPPLWPRGGNAARVRRR
jgi:hypothetical protein